MDINKQLSESAVLQELGGRIALHRLNRNLTQAQLAKEAGVSLSTVNRMEAGNSTQLSNLVRVLRALGLTENLNLLIPPPAISPIQQLKMEGKARKRARPVKDATAASSGPWSWDEATTEKLKKKPQDRGGDR
ncbi:MAG: helix-turn-helix transcriptional regulator [Pseudohongiellaceae bacterium]